MKHKRTPEKRKKTTIPEAAATPEDKEGTPSLSLKLAVRDREQLMKVHGPRKAPLIETAGNLIARTEFCPKDNWRKIPTPLDGDEIDFRSLDSSQLDFAVFWEYAREIRALYHEIRIPVPAEGANALPWAKLSDFFPIPITRLVSNQLLKIGIPDQEKVGLPSADFWKPSPGFSEIDPMVLMSLLQNLLRGRENIKSGVSTRYQKCSSQLNWWRDQIVGIGPARFSNTLTLSTESPDAVMSFHSVRVDWSRGISAIKSEFNRWVDETFQQFTSHSSASVFKKTELSLSREVKAKKIELFQLGAWRAKRAGLDATQFIEYRVNTFMPDFTFTKNSAIGGADRIKKKAKELADKLGWPRYLRNEDFNSAAAEAEARIGTYASKLARFDCSKTHRSASAR